MAVIVSDPVTSTYYAVLKDMGHYCIKGDGTLNTAGTQGTLNH